MQLQGCGQTEIAVQISNIDNVRRPVLLAILGRDVPNMDHFAIHCLAAQQGASTL